jgi:hypothetical protein
MVFDSSGNAGPPGRCTQGLGKRAIRICGSTRSRSEAHVWMEDSPSGNGCQRARDQLALAMSHAFTAYARSECPLNVQVTLALPRLGPIFVWPQVMQRPRHARPPRRLHNPAALLDTGQEAALRLERRVRV